MPKATFTLDSRLEQDCIILGRLKLCHLLLMNNAAVPWYILVPETSATEICDLGVVAQAVLFDEINVLSRYVQGLAGVKKLNVAAIGNVVSQLHVHIVGRHPGDFAWPGVVWGVPSEEEYTDEQISEIALAVKEDLGDEFRARAVIDSKNHSA